MRDRDDCYNDLLEQPAIRKPKNIIAELDICQGLLTGRDNIEERALFGYSDELNKRYKEKYFTAYNAKADYGKKLMIQQMR